MNPLTGKDFQIVAVVRGAFRRGVVVFASVTFSASGGDQTAQRTRPLARGSLPVQSVLLARRADELLCVLGHAVLICARLGEILPLGQNIGARSENRRQLILANSPVQDLLDTRLSVEAPPLLFFYNRDGKGPIALADRKGELSFIHALEFGGLFNRGSELIHLAIVLYRISREQLLQSAGAEDLSERSAIFCLRRLHERLHGIFRSSEEYCFSACCWAVAAGALRERAPGRSAENTRTANILFRRLNALGRHVFSIPLALSCLRSLASLSGTTSLAPNPRIPITGVWGASSPIITASPAPKASGA